MDTPNKFKIGSILALVILTFTALTTAQTVTVPQGTSIRLRLSQNVSSADANAGDATTLEVLDDVKVGQVIAIRHGAQARGTVAEAHSKRRIGRVGAVAINIASLEAADGTRVPVSVEQKSKGDNKSGTITAGIVGSAVALRPRGAVLPLNAWQGHPALRPRSYSGGVPRVFLPSREFLRSEGIIN